MRAFHYLAEQGRLREEGREERAPQRSRPTTYRAVHESGNNKSGWMLFSHSETVLPFARKPAAALFAAAAVVVAAYGQRRHSGCCRQQQRLLRQCDQGQCRMTRQQLLRRMLQPRLRSVTKASRLLPPRRLLRQAHRPHREPRMNERGRVTSSRRRLLKANVDRPRTIVTLSCGKSLTRQRDWNACLASSSRSRLVVPSRCLPPR